MRIGAAVLWMAMAMVAGCGDDGVAPSPDAAPSVDAPPPAPMANGTLGPWLAGPTLPVPRANHSSVILGDDLVVIGGNYRPVAGGPFVRLDAVDASAIGDDGTLAPWRHLGTLPSPVSEPTAAVWGDTVLVIDGLHDDTNQDGQVWAATRQPDGMLGTFTSLGPLPAGRNAIAMEAYVVGDKLYVTSGQLPIDGDRLTLLVTTLGVTPLVWTELTIAPAPGWRGQPEFVFTGNAIHALGGYLGGNAQVVTDVQWAHLDLPHGVATPAADETPLLAPTAAGEAIAVDGFAFLVGGKPAISGSMGQTAVSVAPIAADGSLGAWTPSTPLPVGRTNHDLALGPTHLYLTGGSLASGGLDTVFTAQVRFAP